MCTGLASRGIDFVDVAHVVQFEVALNAVEFAQLTSEPGVGDTRGRRALAPARAAPDCMRVPSGSRPYNCK